MKLSRDDSSLGTRVGVRSTMIKVEGGLSEMLENDGHNLILWRTIGQEIRNALVANKQGFSLKTSDSRVFNFVLVPVQEGSPLPALQVTESTQFLSERAGKNIVGERLVWRMPLVVAEETKRGLSPEMLRQLYSIESADAVILRSLFSGGVARAQVALLFQA